MKVWWRKSWYNMVKNKYTHSIELKHIRVKNSKKEDFAKALFGEGKENAEAAED